MYDLDWSKYPDFNRDEMKCRSTGECDMHPDMMEILQNIRDSLQQPVFVSSGYRSVKNPIEQEKAKPGEHTFGMAVDIICHGERALKIIFLALENNVRRIGVHQKGNVNGRFVHIGIADRYKLEFPKSLWTY